MLTVGKVEIVKSCMYLCVCTHKCEKRKRERGDEEVLKL